MQKRKSNEEIATTLGQVKTRIVTLVPKDGKFAGYNRTKVRVKVETGDYWYGIPVSNPTCPTLEYPKFAWKREA